MAMWGLCLAWSQPPLQAAPHFSQFYKTDAFLTPILTEEKAEGFAQDHPADIWRSSLASSPLPDGQADLSSDLIPPQDLKCTSCLLSYSVPSSPLALL